MNKKHELLIKRHALIEKKLQKMNGFPMFLKEVQTKHPDEFSDQAETLTRYETQNGTNMRLKADKVLQELEIQKLREN